MMQKRKSGFVLGGVSSVAVDRPTTAPTPEFNDEHPEGGRAFAGAQAPTLRSADAVLSTREIGVVKR